MRRQLGYLLVLLSISLLASNVSANLLITNVNVVTKEGSLLQAVSVYIENAHIVKIAKVIVPAAKHELIAGRGRYLIPGLIDTHVHLQSVPGESDAMPEKLRAMALQQIPKSYLYFGFTSLLDLISDNEQMERWNKQDIAPKAYHCAAVPLLGGYPLSWLSTDEQLSNPMAEFFLYDPRQQALMASIKDSELYKAKPLIARIAKTRAKCVKVFYEKGFGPQQNLPVPTVEMMQDLVKEADRHQLPVFVHGNSALAHEFAIEAGAKMLVHGLWHGVDKPASEKLVSLARNARQKGVLVQPTLQVIVGEAEMFDPQFFQRDAVKVAIPKDLANWYQSPLGQWFAEKLAVNFGLAQEAKDQRYRIAKEALQPHLKLAKAHVGALLDEGASLRFGSDTPSGPIYTQFPGYNGRQEIQHWVEMGVPLKTLFQALTYKNAQILKLEDSIGSVETGKVADLLLLSQNPIATAGAYDSIDWVILRGQAIRREALAANP